LARRPLDAALVVGGRVAAQVGRQLLELRRMARHQRERLHVHDEAVGRPLRPAGDHLLRRQPVERRVDLDGVEALGVPGEPLPGRQAVGIEVLRERLVGPRARPYADRRQRRLGVTLMIALCAVKPFAVALAHGIPGTPPVHVALRVGTVTRARKYVVLRTVFRNEKAPPARVVADPAALSFVREEPERSDTFTPASPARLSRSAPESVAVFFFTFAFRLSCAGSWTKARACTVPAGLGVPVLTVYGVVSAVQP